jgi:fermentation-respiration switch protein FrsA (DUF1100 family)
MFPLSKVLWRSLFWLTLGASLLMLSPVRSALEHHFLYFPDPDPVATPDLYGMDYEAVRFEAADGTLLNGWLIPGPAESPLVLFFMGNAGNMSYRLDNLLFLHRLGVSIFIYDYRGYGRSDGKACEPGLYSDALGALEFLRGRGWTPPQMIFFGRSLGAAVALQTAIDKTPAGLVLESPFTSIKAMGKVHNPLLSLLLGWALDADYDNLHKIGRLKSPLLIFHGEKDSICPPDMARTLYEQAPFPKELAWITDADHNETFDKGGPSYQESWERFLRQCTSRLSLAAPGDTMAR